MTNTTIPATDQQRLTQALKKAFGDFISEFEAFDESSINKVPFAGSWTPARVATHIILATDGVPDHKTGKTDRAFDAELPKIRPWWEDLNQKFKSPEPLKPDDQPKEKSKLLSELNRVREKDLAIIAKDDLSLLCLDFELPSIGFLTRYEWLWFIEMHLKRHTYQLTNMRK